MVPCCLRNRYICQSMKVHPIIIFRILLPLAVLFCYGINAYSNPGISRISIHLASGSGDVGFTLSEDADSFCDDQMYETLVFSSNTTLFFPMSIQRHCFLTTEFCCAVWQPPKIS